MSPEERMALVREYEAGASADVLAVHHDISRHGVLDILHFEGARLRMQQFTPDEVTACVDLYLAGSTLREIQADLGLPKTTVRENLRRHGVAMRPAARRMKT